MTTEGIKKKIVIKKPGAPAEEESVFFGGRMAPSAEEAEAEAEAAAAEFEEQQIEFKGEIFDQYYNPLYLEANEGKIEEIACEPLQISAGEARLSKEDLATREQLRQQGAEALAKQIYNLAQVRRETGLDFYLSAIQQTVGEESSEETKELLDRANSFFSNYYDTAIKERGERPEIFAQVTKRVGHGNEERIRRIVTGFDIKGAARELFEICHSEIPNKQEIIREALRQCTEKEVRALRSEVTRIPIRELASLMRSISTAPLDAKPETESADYWQRVKQAQAEKAARVKATLRFDHEMLCYILRGRTAEETEQILYQYDVLFAGDDLRVQNLFLQDLSQRFGKGSQEIEILSRGFDPERCVDLVSNLMNTDDLQSLLEGDMLGALAEVEEPPKLGSRYLGTFRKRRAVRHLDGLYEPIIDARPGLIALVEYMTAEELAFVNGLLEKRHGFTLEAENYPVAGHVDPRERALAMIEALRTRERLYFLLGPLAYLNPLQCMEVARAYACVCGRNLREDLTGRVSEIYGGKLPPGIERLLNSRLDGRLRWPLNVDLLARFRGEALERNGSLGAWDIDEVATPVSEEGALYIANIINDERLGPEEKGEQVRDFVASKTYAELNGIEHAFYQLSDPSEPLLGLLEGTLSEQHYAEISMLFAGFDVRALIDTLSQDLGAVYALRNAPIDTVRLARSLYEERTGRSLVLDLKEALAGEESFHELVDTLSIVYLPEAFEFMTLLLDLQRDQETALRRLRQLWRRNLVDALALERAFDYRYGRVRLQLKAYATKGVMPTEDFIECILYLEGIPADVPAIVVRCINDNDIAAVKQVLAENRDDQPTIEECCDLLLVDSLRRTLLNMPCDTDAINEVILHLDAYYPPEIAQEVRQILEGLEGDELGREILYVLRDPTPDDWNSRVPNDQNWSGEMLNQIRVAYETQFGSSLLNDLRLRGVNNSDLERIAARIFGNEPTAIALELYTLMRNEIDESPEQEQGWAKIIEEISIRGSRSRQRVLDVYRQLFSVSKPVELIEEIGRYTQNPETKAKLLELLKLEGPPPSESGKELA